MYFREIQFLTEIPAVLVRRTGGSSLVWYWLWPGYHTLIFILASLTRPPPSHAHVAQATLNLFSIRR